MSYTLKKINKIYKQKNKNLKEIKLLFIFENVDIKINIVKNILK